MEQNRRHCQSFDKILSRLHEVFYQFFIKQWHDEADQELINEVVSFVMKHYGLETLPEISSDDKSKFPPMLKVRGLFYRDNTKFEHLPKDE